MRTDDGCIIYECLHGKPEAFGMLVAKYKDGVYAFVYGRLGNFHDAQDVTQEVFEQAYRSLSGLRRWESFTFWLYRIAHNLCMDWNRTQSKRPDREFIDDQTPTALENSSLDSYHENEVNESLREALDSLPEIYREVLLLHYFGGMNIKEIARAIGASPTAIGKRLSRARADLREEMIAIMDTAFDNQRLQSSFTFYIVEAVKRIKVHPISRSTSVPWGLSLATGILLALFSLGSHLSWPTFFEPPTNLASIKESQISEISQFLVDMTKMPRLPGYQGNDGGDPGLSFRQNAVLMTQQGEGGKFPEKPSVQLGKGRIDDLAYSPDGKLLAVAGVGRGIRLYDANNLNEVALLPGSSYYRVIFSPDGKILAASDLDWKIDLWDVDKQKQMGTLKGHTSDIYSIAFSPDGKTLASGSWDKTIRLWDIQQQKQIGLLNGHTEGVPSVAFSPDGRILASGSYDKTLRFWDIQGQRQIGLLQGHADALLSVAFSPDGKILASGSWDKTIRLWDVQEQKQIGLLQGTNGISSIAFNPDGKILTSTSNKTVDLWNIQEQKQMGSLQEYKTWWRAIISPDGKTIASGCDTAKGSAISFWNIQEQRQTGLLDGFTDIIYSLAFSPDGKSLAAGGYDKILLWDIQGQKQTEMLEGYSSWWSGPVGTIFSPDGKIMASIVAKEIYLFDVQERKQVGTLKGHTGGISSIAFTPDGKILASSGNEDQTVRLWDVAKQKEIGVLMNGSWTHCLAISPDGETVAVSVGAENLVRLWDIKTQKAVGVLQDACNAYSVAFSHDGETIASGNQCGEIILWNVKNQKKIEVLQGPVVSAMQVFFSPDGKWLASFGCYNANGNIDNTIRIWDVKEQKQIATVEEHTGQICSVAFSPDGKWMASGGEDGIILLWEVNIPVQGKAVESTGKLPGTWGEVKETALLQNFPNPFNPETWIPYSLSEDTDVKIRIHSASGNLVRTLNLGHKTSGMYLSKDKAAYWDGKNEDGESVASDIYFYMMETGEEYIKTRKMVIMR